MCPHLAHHGRARLFGKSARAFLRHRFVCCLPVSLTSVRVPCILYFVCEDPVLSIDSIKTVAVLGAGTMGNGIAHVFARAGYKVLLRDIEQRYLDAALDTIGKNLDREIKKGQLAEAEKRTVLERLLSRHGIAASPHAHFLV